MKYSDIERIASGIVRDYLDDGWTLQFSFNCGAFALERDGEELAVGFHEVGRYHDEESDLDRYVLFVSRNPKGANAWLDDFLDPENVICERVFFKAGKDWYVEDEDMALTAEERRFNRRKSRDYGAEERWFNPTKAFLDKWVRSMYGWKTVRPSDVRVTRCKGWCHGYRVEWYRVYKVGGDQDSFDVEFPDRD